MKKHTSLIYINNQWVRVKPIIRGHFDLGNIPNNALYTSENKTFITNDRKYFLIEDANSDSSSNSISLIENMVCKACIQIKASGENTTINNTLMAKDNVYLLDENGKYILVK